MNIHIINAHEPNMIWEHLGIDWVMKNKDWIQHDQWKQTWRSLTLNPKTKLVMSLTASKLLGSLTAKQFNDQI